MTRILKKEKPDIVRQEYDNPNRGKYHDEDFKIIEPPYIITRYIKIDDLKGSIMPTNYLPINKEIDISQKFETENKYILIQKQKCNRCNKEFYPKLDFYGKLTIQVQCPLCKSPYWNKIRKLVNRKNNNILKK